MTTPPLVQEQCLMPAPHEAHAATMRHVKLGSPSAVYAYRDRAGAVLGYICRFDTPEGKQILPLTYWQMEQGAGWRWKGFPEPRPLYGLDKLAAHPHRPVLVCEGEKAADAAQQLVPDYVCVTSSGGSNAAHKADWVAVCDRKVFIWPDNDEAGQKYAQAVANILSTGNQVRIIALPADKSIGWDAADALAEGWDRTPVDALIATSKHALPPTDTIGIVQSVSSVSGDDVWPDPKPVKHQLLPVEPLPISILPEAYQAWISDLSHRMQCPPDIAACTAITMTGSIIGTACGIRPKRRDDWLIVPNLFGAAVARPSVLLKSPTMQEVLKPLLRLEAEAIEAHGKERMYFEAESEMKKAERDGIRKEMSHLVKKRSADSDAKEMLKHKYVNLGEADGEPILRRYRTNNTTPESLNILLEQNPRGVLVFCDELMNLIGGWEKEGRETERGFYLEAWNGKQSYISDRVGRGSLITPNMCVSIFGGIQPDKLFGYLNECRKSNDGMFQRFQMMVYPDEPKNWTLVDEYPDTEAKNQAYEIIKRLSEMDFTTIGAERKDEDSTPFLRYSTDAQEMFYEWLTDLEVTKLRGTAMEPMMAEHLGKFRKLMPTLSLIFHLVDAASGMNVGNGVSLQAAERAAAWCEYLESHARRIYGLVESLPIKAAAILAARVKKKALGTSFTVRDVYRRQWSFLTDKDIAQAACDILVEAGWLRESVIESSFGQRGKTDYLVNPKLWDGDHE